ncbi:MAG: hypothetical protein IKM97_04985 [Clostridia bacterium]|nr:hypothetical protein [Clostridia bacterium]
MISKELKEKVLKEKKLDVVLYLLKDFQNEKWDDDIIKHLQEITPEDDDPINNYSYQRKK